MKVFLDKSRVLGMATAPPSKSYTIRALVCAALADGKSRLENPLDSEDTRAARDVLRGIGVKTSECNGSWVVEGGNFHQPVGELFCRDSAATLRFMLAICSFVPGNCRLVPSAALARRPIAPLVKALEDLGAEIREEGQTIITSGSGFIGGSVELPGDISSQFISAILMAAPLAREKVHLVLKTQPQSRNYIAMTIRTMASFGVRVETSDDFQDFLIPPQQYRAAEFEIEGDWSSASFLLAIGATSGRLKVRGLNLESLQGDRLMLDLLQQMGARVKVEDDGVSVAMGEMMAVSADLKDAIDLLPPLSAVASLCPGESSISGVERARFKESDRVLSMKENLERMGIGVRLDDDRLFIRGGAPVQAVVQSYNDHRIAMAFSIIGAAKGGVAIEGAECVSKTYPGYWDTLKDLGVRLSEQ